MFLDSTIDEIHRAIEIAIVATEIVQTKKPTQTGGVTVALLLCITTIVIAFASLHPEWSAWQKILVVVVLGVGVKAGGGTSLLYPLIHVNFSIASPAIAWTSIDLSLEAINIFSTK